MVCVDGLHVLYGVLYGRSFALDGHPEKKYNYFHIQEEYGIQRKAGAVWRKELKD